MIKCTLERDDKDERCEDMKMRLKNNIIVFILALVISLILNAVHMLLPFMFGPIIASIICVKVFKMKVEWPQSLGLLGMILLGVQIGSTFTKKVILEIKDDWLSIVFITLMLLTLSMIIAYFFKKIAKVNYETAVLSVVPGALSQMLIMAEENKKANIMVVSLTQTSRIIFVVILVPLISFFFKDSGSGSAGASSVKPLTQMLSLPNVIILIVAIALVYYIMDKIKFPTKQLLAPIIVLIAWNLITGINFKLDNFLIAGAQIIYMIRIGIQISKLLDQMKGRVAVAIAFQNISLILLSFIMVLIISTFTKHPINELFLGAAPGGMSQIVLVAIETGADVARISSYHIFRIFFILFVIAPLISYLLKYLAKLDLQKEKNEESQR